jgi:hypothetical protein
VKAGPGFPLAPSTIPGPSRDESPTQDLAKVRRLYLEAEKRGRPRIQAVCDRYPGVTRRTVVNAINEALGDLRNAGQVSPKPRGRPRKSK